MQNAEFRKKIPHFPEIDDQNRMMRRGVLEEKIQM